MQGMSKDPTYAGDFGTPEQEIPATGFPGVDWESCMTMNDTWGFRKDDNHWKSAQAIIRMVIDTSSKGGNLLLNVGPTGEGLIPEPSVERLAEVGKWMKVNSESIYGTSASPFKKLSFGRCTRNGAKLYLHVFDWPKDGTLIVPLSNKPTSAALLAFKDQPITATATEQGIQLKLPAITPDPNATVIALEVEGEPQVIASAAVRQRDDGTITLSAADADLTGQLQVESKGGAANIGFWMNAADTAKWQVQVNKSGTFNVEVTYACEPASAGSEYVIVVGDQQVAGKVEATKAWTDFATAQLGTIKIEKTGVTNIVVKPSKKPGLAVMNLQSIVLKPA